MERHTTQQMVTQLPLGVGKEVYLGLVYLKEKLSIFTLDYLFYMNNTFVVFVTTSCFKKSVHLHTRLRTGSRPFMISAVNLTDEVVHQCCKADGRAGPCNKGEAPEVQVYCGEA